MLQVESTYQMYANQEGALQNGSLVLASSILEQITHLGQDAPHHTVNI